MLKDNDESESTENSESIENKVVQDDEVSKVLSSSESPEEVSSRCQKGLENIRLTLTSLGLISVVMRLVTRAAEYTQDGKLPFSLDELRNAASSDPWNFVLPIIPVFLLAALVFWIPRFVTVIVFGSWIGFCGYCLFLCYSGHFPAAGWFFFLSGGVLFIWLSIFFFHGVLCAFQYTPVTKTDHTKTDKENDSKITITLRDAPNSTFVVVLLIGVVAFVTNPDEVKLKNELKNQLSSQRMSEDPSFIEGALMMALSHVGKIVIEQTIDVGIERENYYFWSVFKLNHNIAAMLDIPERPSIYGFLGVFWFVSEDGTISRLA